MPSTRPVRRVSCGGDDHRGGLAGADAVGHEHARVRRGEDPPHDVFLVRARCEVGGEAGQREVRAVVARPRYRLNMRL